MNASETRPGKILMVEVGADEHDRSAQALAAGLRDGGMEVVFTGRLTTADALVRSALEEDVDLILICGSETNPPPAEKIIEALDRCGLQHIGLIGAGIGDLESSGLTTVVESGPPDGKTLAKLRNLAMRSRINNRGLRE